MKLLHLTLLAACLSCLFANRAFCQENNTLSFTYDEQGNITQRKVQVFVQGRFGNVLPPKDSVAADKPFLNVFPNPTNQYLNIEGRLPDTFADAKVKLLSTTGAVLKEDLFVSSISKKMYVGDLKAGMYVLEVIYSEKERNTYKIIITN